MDKFILDRNFKISIENKYGYSILDIFNMIDTSEIIPYVVVNDEDTYYKINKHIKPPKEWIEVEKYKENGIMLKILGTEKFTSDKIGSQYVDVMIMIDENNIVITMQTITLKGITQSETINRLQKSIKLNISDYILTNVSIAGTFYIPLQNIDMDIFSDMAMNDKIISRYIDIDEHVKLQKKKTQTYIYFYKSNNVIATANITNQIVEPRDSILRTLSEKDREYFPVGSSYLRIRITKTQDNDSLNIFYNIFRKLISRYNQESENVAKFYKKYGIELLRESEKPSGKKIKKWLKDIDHDIFGPESKYTRQCEKKREPRIVNDEEAELLKSKGIDVMKYPRDGAIEYKEIMYVIRKMIKVMLYINIQVLLKIIKERLIILKISNVTMFDLLIHKEIILNGMLILNQKSKKKLSIEQLHLGLSKDQKFYKLDKLVSYRLI